MSTETAPAPPIRGRRRSSRRPPESTGALSVGRSRWLPYLFSAPAIILVSLILAYPVLWGLVQSLFRRQRLGRPLTFVGVQNYTELFATPEFWDSLVKTGIFVVGCLVLGTTLGLVFGFALSRAMGAMRFLRAVSIAPYIVSNVAAAVMFRVIFNGNFGPINATMRSFGLDGLPWLSDPALAMVVVIVCQVWTDLPLTILLVLAGLQSIDKSYLEAALVDGASGWQRAAHISLPLVSPQIALAVIWQSYSTLTGLGVVLALTGGGPQRGTAILPIEMYDTAFISLQQNQALAIGAVLFALNALLTVIYLRVAKRFGVDE